MSWDFSKLPKSEYNNAIHYFKSNDIDLLVKLHNDYKLSSNDYCCSPDEAMINWWGHAIKTKIIYETE